MPTECPKCGGAERYYFATRKIWRCKKCRCEWSAMSRSIYRAGKKPIEEFNRLLASYKSKEWGSVRQWFVSEGLDGHTGYSLFHRWKLAGLI